MIFKPGDRIKLLSMGNDPDPIPYGTLGTVQRVVDLSWGGKNEWQVQVDWDNGRTLSLVCPPDLAVKTY